MMSVVKLTNPVDAIGSAIADPLEQVAKDLKQLSDLHTTANEHLKQSGHDLVVTMGKDIAQPFTDMINKQYQFAAGIDKGINEIADLYNEAAQAIRTAAHWIDPVLNVAFDLLQWAVDQLTADIIVRQGQSAVQAIFDDLRNQINRAESDAGNFFGDLFHLNLGAALHDAEDEGKALLHIAGDALAMVATVEPLLCQWAEDIFQAVNWCMNQVQSVLLGIVDWVFSLSDIVSEVVVFTDPNSTDLEKWIAGGELVLNVGLDIIMLIPGAQEAIFGRLIEKLGIKFAAEWLAKKIAETLVAKVIADIIAKFLESEGAQLARQMVDALIKQAVEKGLSQIEASGLRDDLKRLLIDKYEQIFADLDAKKITQKQFDTKIKEVNEIVASIFDKPEYVRSMMDHDIKLADLYTAIEDSNPDFRLTPNNAITALTGPDGTVRVEVAGPSGTGGDIKFYDDKGNLIFTRENKCLTTTSRSGFNGAVSDAMHEIPDGQPGEIFLQMQPGTNPDDIASWVKRYMGSRIAAGQADKYKNILIKVVDPSGNVIYAGKMMP